MNPHVTVGVFLYLCYMDKILTYLLIMALTKDERKTKMIMEVLYSDKPKMVKASAKPQVKQVPVVSDKKKEVMDAIDYLKSKPRKTKQDKEKIQMLEVIVKSL